MNITSALSVGHCVSRRRSVRLKEFVHDHNSHRRTTNATPHRVRVWKQTCHEKETVWTDMGSEY